jgi:hypothetical protein
VFSGYTYGLGSRSSTGDSVLMLYEELAARGGSVRVTGVTQGLLRGGWLLFDEQGSQAVPVKAITAGGRWRAERLTAVRGVETRRNLVVQHPPQPNLDLPAMIQRRNAALDRDPTLRSRSCSLYRLRRAKHMLLALRVGKGPAAPPVTLHRDPLDWELRWVLRLEARLGTRKATALLTLKPYGEGRRRLPLIEARRRALGDKTLLLGAGNQVSVLGKRPRTGGVDRRELAFSTLKRMRYDAIVPGPTELYFGLGELRKRLARHRLPLVATNLVFRRGPRKGKPVFAPYKLLRVGGVKVAVLGIVGPGLPRRVSEPKAVASLVVRDPVKETSRWLGRLRELPETQPDVVIVLTHMRGKHLSEYNLRVRGVDVLLGAFQGGRSRPREVVTLGQRLRTSRQGRSVALMTRSSHAMVGELSIDFRRRGPRWDAQRIEHREHLVDDTLPYDREAHRAIMRGELAVLSTWRPIMPAIETIFGKDKALHAALRRDPEIARWLPAAEQRDWQLWMTGRFFAQLLANLLQQSAGAEVALVRRYNLAMTIPGPILEYYVAHWIDRDDPLLLYELSGKRLRKLLERRDGSRTHTALAGADGASFKVGGRPIVGKQLYRVIVTRAVANAAPFAQLLRGLTPQRRFTLKGRRLRGNSDGKRLTSRQAVLAVLQQLRREYPRFGPAYRRLLRRWLRPSGSTLVPRWTIAARGLSLSFASYRNGPQGAWQRNPGVRETRTVTPNNYVLGVRGALALTYDSARLRWTTQVALKLSRTVIDLGSQEFEQEPVDDLVASTELRLKVIEVALGAKRRVRIVPYVSGSFDTELTPTQNFFTGVAFPHQKELRVAAGVTSSPSPYLPEIRLAGLFRNDFSLDSGQAEAGLLAAVKVEIPLWKAKLQLSSRLRYYPDTEADTIEDLGLIVEATSKLIVPFTRDLSLSLFADLYLYKPKVARVTIDRGDGISEVIDRGSAVSLILGGAIQFDHLWQL